LIQIFRIIYCYLLVAFLYDHPIIQTVQFTLINVAMMIYFIKERPFKALFNFFVTMTYESLMFVVNICLLCLAILDSKGTLTSDQEFRFGNTIIVCNTLIDTFATIYMYSYICLGFYQGYRSWKNHGTQGKTVWLHAFLSIYETPGMDFLDEKDTDAGGDMKMPKIKIFPQKTPDFVVYDNQIQERLPGDRYRKMESSASLYINNLDSDVESSTKERTPMTAVTSNKGERSSGFFSPFQFGRHSTLSNLKTQSEGDPEKGSPGRVSSEIDSGQNVQTIETSGKQRVLIRSTSRNLSSLMNENKSGRLTEDEGELSRRASSRNQARKNQGWRTRLSTFSNSPLNLESPKMEEEKKFIFGGDVVVKDKIEELKKNDQVENMLGVRLEHNVKVPRKVSKRKIMPFDFKENGF